MESQNQSGVTKEGGAAELDVKWQSEEGSEDRELGARRPVRQSSTHVSVPVSVSRQHESVSSPSPPLLTPQL